MLLSAKPKRLSLYAALEQNKDLTLNNQYFYGYLINALNSCLRSGLIEGEKKDELESWITHYEQLKISAEYKNALFNSENQVLIEEISQILLKKERLKPAMIEALKQDERDNKREYSF